MLPSEIPQDDISVAWSAKADKIHDWSDLSCRVIQSARGQRKLFNEVESIEGGESMLGCRLIAKHQTSSLVLDTKEGLDHFSFQGPDDFHCASVYERLHVDAVELLQSG